MATLPGPPPADSEMVALEAGQMPDCQLRLNPSTNSSAKTQNYPSPNKLTPINSASIVRSWKHLRSTTVNGIHRQKESLRHRYGDFRDYVQLSIVPRNSRPKATIVLSFLCILIIFATLLCVGAKVPVESMWITILVFGGTCSIGLTIRYFLSHRANRENIYRPNLGNTIAIVLLTVPTFTILYVKLWYPGLSLTDSVTNVRFPSIAVFQRSDWSSQGTLRSGGSKCYLGWYNDDAPKCANLDPQTFGNSTECTCADLWYNNDEVIEDFVWQNTSYRYVAFDSPTWLICNNPTYLLLLQTFFDYNATEALVESSTVNPSLLIAVYDPTLGLQEAFEMGYTRMNLINANGIVAVNIGLQVRQGLDGNSAYDYTLGLSSSPARDLVCDTSSATTYQYPCHVSLFVQIPSFDRTTISTVKDMEWLDVAASAGAYFSFVQFVSWIVSAQAFIA